ncbi:MAG TPA: ATP-binding cassette domain-containing protein [Halanaerobiales bacterium]|nr:ATP-binding cassette domain-containing protein [Bacillota bacterium]HOA39908.1 ATP-binding cassette domain-containing protein [Halanaerobiales bacterium]HPZ61983.1 ATP-binding cassette domain-containing protein [Halanaerobiales bacterium]HQD03294.1 ATP-binding cassette domain-containing protein [Halanaerobiales bacterium]
MSEYVLKVEGINKSFRQNQVVKDISFEVKKGEILGLLGPNGAGKTTVIRMIMGIFQPDSGLIRFDRDYIIDKKRIGYLPEERGTYDDTRVLETIVYFARLKGLKKGEAEERAMNWLEKMGLKDYARNKMEELSKGMQQKVQFIISVIHNPVLLVLDEVFSGLDPVNQNLFKEIIRELAAAGITILLSSHQMNLVEELCDRIFMINKGERVLYGALEDIKDKGIRTVSLKSRKEISDFNLKGNNKVLNLQVNGKAASFQVLGNLSFDNILEMLPEDVDIDELSILKPPLHDIFVATVNREVL